MMPVDPASETVPAIHEGRWRRLHGMVNARVFGDAPPSVGRYRLQRALGSGAMGVVFSALDTELQREVAIKLLTTGADDDRRRRLQREAQAIARVSHPNVIGVYDVGEHDGELFVAMELVVGRTLRAWLDAGPHPWRQVARRFAAAARGLAAAHAAGLVHRDFKPENVLVDESAVGVDGVPRVCVVDFGLVTRGAERTPAPALDPDERDGAVSIPFAGTPVYMAPEQILGRPVDARADVWSLCVALFEALYGVRPFDRGSIGATFDAAMRGEIAWPRARRGVPRRIEKLIARGLRADRDARTLDCAAIARELEAATAKRNRLAIVGVAAIATASAVVALSALGMPAPVCDDAAAALADAWNDERRATVTARLHELAIADADTIAGRLDAYAERWSAELESTCDASTSHSGRLAVQACLQDRRDALAATVGVLADADEVIARNREQLVASLADPSLCADPRTRPELVTDDAEPVQAAAWRLELARARALWNVGEDTRATELAASTLAAARDAHAWSTVADAGVLLGEIAFVGAGDLEAIAPTIAEARGAAARVGWQAAIARADALLIEDPRETDASTVHRRFSAARAEADAARDPEALALVAIATGQLGASTLELDSLEASNLSRMATELAHTRLGAGHRLLRELEQPSRRPGRAPTVLAARAKLAQTAAKWPPDGATTTFVRVEYARALSQAGLSRDAVAEQSRAVTALKRHWGETSRSYVDGLVALYYMQAATGDVDAAVATVERAIAANEANPAELGRPTSEYLANVAAVLLLEHGETERAVGLARRAMREPDRFERVSYALTLAYALAQRAELDEASAILDELWTLMHERDIRIAPASVFRARIRLIRAEIALQRGQLDEAEEDFRAALPDLLSTMSRHRARAHLGLATIAARAGDTATRDRELALIAGS